MRRLSIPFLCALSASACDSGASVRAGVSLESGASVRMGSGPAEPVPPVVDSVPATRSSALAATRECSANYDPCVPVDSDVDCAGGSGNGPSYVAGPVRVIGRDVYGLDRNGDGVGCE